MDSTTGSIVGAGVTALGNIALDTAHNKRQFKFQQKAMAQQQQYNKEMWDYQNAYNTPQAQMERLKAAGLNPHLVYGQGSAGAGNAGPLQAAEVPTREASRAEMPNLFMNHLMVRQMDAQYEATKQKTESARTQAALLEAKTGLENLRLMREGLRSKNYKDLAEAEAMTQKFVALRSGSLYENAKSQGNLMDQLYGFRAKTNEDLAKGISLDTAFKENRNDLAKLGIYQSDDPKLRILIQAAKRLNIDLGELLVRGYQKLEYLFK